MRKILLLFTAFFLFLLSGCNSSSSSGTTVWIDVPINNLYLSDPQPIIIQGHAASPGGVSLVEIWVNGEIIESLTPTAASDNLSTFETIYTPTETGEYLIQVTATGSDGTASDPDTALVLIGEAFAAIPVEDLPTYTPTWVITLTPTATLVPPADEGEDENPAVITPEPVVKFWADPPEISAGNCTTLYWEINNVSQVEFGGTNQALSGNYYDCMCETQTYPLKVTYYDGTQETFRVTINVTGDCATSTPIPDTQAPNPPALLKPVNGYTFSCIADLILRWEAANDPSGIGEYRVQVERHPGDNNWQAVSGSPFTGLTVLEKLLTVECGYTYRWRVRAVDGAGNIGSWSQWFTFVIPLT